MAILRQVMTLAAEAAELEAAGILYRPLEGYEAQGCDDLWEVAFSAWQDLILTGGSASG